MNPFDAIYTNNVEALREYLEVGNVNTKNERGMSLLHYAIIFNNQEIFDLLLENYINVNIQDNFGDTPLLYCIINNRMGFLKTLLNKKADLKIKNKDGQSALFKACALGREEMVFLLLESINYNLYETDSNNETVFMALIRSRNLKLLEQLPVDDEIVNVTNYLGEAPLHIAAKTADSKIINYLLSHKAYVNLKNNTKETPLFYAVAAANYEAIDLLIKNGAVLDCKSSFSETIYDLTLNEDVLNYIDLKKEAYKVNEYNNLYPLHHAILVENMDLVKKYATLGNINRKDSFGFAPIDIANRTKNELIINYLNDTKVALAKNI